MTATSPLDADDQRCVRAMADGDAQALGRLYDRHAPMLLGLACRILGDRAEAEDVLQDLFVEAWKQAATYAPARGSVRAWLAIRLRSRAVDRRRARAIRARVAASGKASSRAAVPADEAVQSPDRVIVHHALASLPAAQRAVIELAYFGGLTCSEVAAELQIPLGTVKSRLASGLSRMRALVEAGARPGGRAKAATPASAASPKGSLWAHLLAWAESLALEPAASPA